MAVELKPHNKEAYEKVVEGFKEKNRVAVVEPPGTGKSFIALKWLEENKDKKIILLVPSYSITLQYEEHIKACGYTLSDFPNLTIMTYSMLLSEVKSGNILKVEGIILDEFHRCGAPEWGKGVETLLEENKNAKILGLSATPIRYLDKNRDMSDELFDGNIVFQMDLTEAVARGILYFPFYINGIYQLDEDIKQYENKIEMLHDCALKETLTKKLEIAKRKLEQATKLDELFSKYMKKKNSKNIIFCKDKKHMDQMIGESYQWFSKVNPEIDIYSVYCEKKNNEEELRNFYNSNNHHLKLLFCIDMLNEGFHDPNIDNIIMLRPTISPILFIQQLGRGLALGNHHVTIYDIVNNSRSNNDIKKFITEVRKKRNELIKEHKINVDEIKMIEKFEVLADIREVFDTLNDIESMLQSFTGKEYKIKLVEEFYQKYHRLPKGNEKYQTVALGMFLNNVKTRNTKLTENQIKRLQVLGFQLEVKDREKEKEEKIRLLEEFYKENKRLPKNNESYKGVLLRNFLKNAKQGLVSLTENQKKRLEILGFDFEIKDIEKEKEKKIKLIEKFYEENKRLPRKTEKSEEKILGSFLHSIKRGLTQITEEQKARLLRLGFQLEVRDKEKTREEKITLLETFYEENKRLPKQGEKYKGVALGTFLSMIKHGEIEITEEQMKRIIKLGFQGIEGNYKIEKRIKKIEQFYKENKRLPKIGEQLGREKEPIGDILLEIKSGKIRITEEQFVRLQNMDVTLTREQVSLIEKKEYVKKK